MAIIDEQTRNSLRKRREELAKTIGRENEEIAHLKGELKKKEKNVKNLVEERTKIDDVLNFL